MNQYIVEFEGDADTNIQLKTWAKNKAEAIHLARDYFSERGILVGNVVDVEFLTISRVLLDE